MSNNLSNDQVKWALSLIAAWRESVKDSRCSMHNHSKEAATIIDGYIARYKYAGDKMSKEEAMGTLYPLGKGKPSDRITENFVQRLRNWDILHYGEGKKEDAFCMYIPVFAFVERNDADINVMLSPFLIDALEILVTQQSSSK